MCNRDQMKDLFLQRYVEIEDFSGAENSSKFFLCICLRTLTHINIYDPSFSSILNQTVRVFIPMAFPAPNVDTDNSSLLQTLINVNDCYSLISIFEICSLDYRVY